MGKYVKGRKGRHLKGWSNLVELLYRSMRNCTTIAPASHTLLAPCLERQHSSAISTRCLYIYVEQQTQQQTGLAARNHEGPRTCNEHIAGRSGESEKVIILTCVSSSFVEPKRLCGTPQTRFFAIANTKRDDQGCSAGWKARQLLLVVAESAQG